MPPIPLKPPKPPKKFENIGFGGLGVRGVYSPYYPFKGLIGPYYPLRALGPYNSLRNLSIVFVKGKYLNLIKGKYLILENRASQPQNADPPTPGQNPHEMGRRKSFRSILGGRMHRIAARIDLDRSRPLKLNFV